MLAVVLLHDALIAEAQVHFGSVGSANRIVIIRAFGLALAGCRSHGRRAGRLQLVAGADFLVAGRSAIYRYQSHKYHEY